MYVEFPYITGENPNGKYGELLAEKMFSCIKGLSRIKKICELGCGNGYFAGRLGRAGYEVTAIDCSETGIAYAEKNHGKYTRFIRSEISPSLTQGLKTQFDLVFSIDVIEHLYCPSDLIKTAGALLKPQGYLLVSTPYHGFLKYLAMSLTNRMDAHLNPLYEGGHIKFFSVKTLSKLISSDGFDEVEFEFLGRFPWLWKNMICLAKKSGQR